MRENGVIELLGIINKMSQNGFGGMSIDVPKMKSGKRRDGSQNQLASNSSMLSINDDGVQEVNLQLGILAELVDTEIIVNSYRMDKYGKQRVIEKLVTLLARIDLLFTTFNSISLESELTLCVEELMGAAQHLTSAESVRLYLIDPLTQELVFDNSSYDRGKKKLDILRFAPGSGIAGYVAKNNMVINVQDAGKVFFFIIEQVGKPRCTNFPLFSITILIQILTSAVLKIMPPSPYYVCPYMTSKEMSRGCLKWSTNRGKAV